MRNTILIIVLFFAQPSGVLFAEELPATSEPGQSTAPLARQGDVVLTHAELDAAFSRVPEDKRLAFIRMGDKVEALVRNLLRNKILAEEARKAGYDQETLVKLRLSLAAEAELAKEWIQQVIAEAPEVDYEAIAMEKYLANKEAWRTENKVDVSHILISSENKSETAAREAATELWETLQAEPERFDEMVLEYSEDPSKMSNGGRFPGVTRGDMVEPFEEVAFALEKQGEISAPVQTAYGFHIIRLNMKILGRIQPFEDIKAQAIREAREKHLREYRNRYLRNLFSGPIVLEQGANEEVAKRYFGENLELAPDFIE